MRGAVLCVAIILYMGGCALVCGCMGSIIIHVYRSCVDLMCALYMFPTGGRASHCRWLQCCQVQRHGRRYSSHLQDLPFRSAGKIYYSLSARFTL